MFNADLKTEQTHASFLHGQQFTQIGVTSFLLYLSIELNLEGELTRSPLSYI